MKVHCNSKVLRCAFSCYLILHSSPWILLLCKCICKSHIKEALSFNSELSKSLPILYSCPHPQRSSWWGSSGYSKNPHLPPSITVLLPLALISLSHWSMIHVCEGLLALCTAAYCRHCACFSFPSLVIMTGLTISLPLTCDGFFFLAFLFSEFFLFL